MTWFAASIIETVLELEAGQSSYVVYENVVLIEAATRELAFEKAEKTGRLVERMGEDLTQDGRPAKRVFVGVRKLITISNPFPLDQCEDPPIDQTEVTYAEFELSTFEEVQALASGEEIIVKYTR